MAKSKRILNIFSILTSCGLLPFVIVRHIWGSSTICRKDDTSTIVAVFLQPIRSTKEVYLYKIFRIYYFVYKIAQKIQRNSLRKTLIYLSMLPIILTNFSVGRAVYNTGYRKKIRHK